MAKKKKNLGLQAEKNIGHGKKAYCLGRKAGW
jgi:hypothetical protein